ncbi:DUF6177 family protein [Streptomyces subrutilus]|uniref:DUF6177 family protein n=1 Tax=Streptomyces subrutilus TaxID=36818 RepID=UPI002447D703|nr:DUF6177 family protein [Streptomyces subrutilus]
MAGADRRGPPPVGWGTSEPAGATWSRRQLTEPACAVATRYDKLAVRYEATVLVAALNACL